MLLFEVDLVLILSKCFCASLLDDANEGLLVATAGLSVGLPGPTEAEFLYITMRKIHLPLKYLSPADELLRGEVEPRSLLIKLLKKSANTWCSFVGCLDASAWAPGGLATLLGAETVFSGEAAAWASYQTKSIKEIVVGKKYYKIRLVIEK